MDFTIEKMRPEDGDAVMEMMRVFYASDALCTNGSEEIFKSDVAFCTGDSPYAEGYVFRRDGGLIGYAMLAKSFSTEFGKPCIWVEDLYVRPPYRGQGIGSAFFERLFSLYGDEVVYRLEAEPGNSPAVALYEKRGFRPLPYLELIRGAETLGGDL